MKMLKKIFAAVCSLTIMATMIGGTTIANAAGTEIDTAYVTLSLDDTDFETTNSFTINFNTPVTNLGASVASVYVPTNLKQYISGWEWVDVFGSSNVTMTAAASGTYISTNYIQLSTSLNVGVSNVTPVNGVFAKLKITLKEALPDTMADADKTIEMAGVIGSRTKNRCTVEDLSGGSTVIYSSLKNTETCGDKNATYWVFDPAVEGNYVVVPAAKAEEPDNTVAFEGFTGTKENGEADGSVSVAAKKSFTTSEDGTSEILWTVTLDDGNDTKKYHTSTVDFAGGADYTLGMVINGLAESLVKTIEAVLQ